MRFKLTPLRKYGQVWCVIFVCFLTQIYGVAHEVQHCFLTANSSVLCYGQDLENSFYCKDAPSNLTT